MKTNQVAILEVGKAEGVPTGENVHIYTFPSWDEEEILFTIKDLKEHYDKVYLCYNGEV